MHEIYLSETYKNTYSLPIGVKAIGKNLNVGPITIFINNRQDVYSGRLNENGVISGLAELFQDKKLESGMTFSYKNHLVNSILLYLDGGSGKNKSTGKPSVDSPSGKLKWHHNEIYYSDNFNRWAPNEVLDVFFAFGLLHEMTDYSYCGALNNEIISKIEYFKRIPNANIRPDAILHHKQTNNYLIAKFESNASDYKKHHNPDDVDVLVVWRDDEKDRSCLPMHVVELYRLAKKASAQPLD